MIRETPTTASNLYAYHSRSLNNAIPYYTLHQNPGFHRPEGADTGKVKGNQPVGAVSLLFAQSSDSTSGPNPNDYDEPYVSMQSDSDKECDKQPLGIVDSSPSVSIGDKVSDRSLCVFSRVFLEYC